MNKKSTTIIDKSVLRASALWKLLRFVRHTCILGTTACTVLIGLGAAVGAKWISSRDLAVIALEIFFALAVLAEVLILLLVFVTSPNRARLVAAIEQRNRGLQDRLNTLVFLQRKPKEPLLLGFAARIADQARRVLKARSVGSPVNAVGTLFWCALFTLVLGVTVGLNQRYEPWRNLRPSPRLKAKTVTQPPVPRLVKLPTNSVEQAWGEVRITDPGNDLRATKVDVVPLAIEAAANHNLRKVAWYSSVNGAPEQIHELPAPRDPRNAQYQPMLYLDELQLADWDILSYYAKAETAVSNSYASEVYFVEVRPFREDILKMPGGEGGQAYQTLNEISSLIGRQQQVIRATHAHVQRPPAGELERAKSREGLSHVESDLGSATQHLYAEMAATMENQPIAQALESLAKAQDSLKDAAGLLKSNVMSHVLDRELAGLSELAATRKMFQQAVSDHPNDFAPPPDGENPPVADSMDKLNQLAEFRDEAKSAKEFIKQLTAQQREVEQKSASPGLDPPAQLADRERDLEKSLKDFVEQHPRPFKNVKPQSDQARNSLQRAEQSLESGAGDAAWAARQATEQLEKLDSEMKAQTPGERMADSYRLRQMLQQQIRALDTMAKQQGPIPANQASNTAETAQQTVEQLSKNVEQEGAGSAFGPSLRRALAPENKAALDKNLAQLRGAQTDEDRRKRAGDSKLDLEKLDQAFATSQPEALQAARQKDALKTDPDSGLEQGLSQMKSLLKQIQKGSAVSSENQLKQIRQALESLRDGMASRSGPSDQGQSLVNQMAEMLDHPDGLDASALKKLLDQLEGFSLESRTKLAGGTNQPELVNVDLARVPLTYRGRIEKYFQKLSEK